MLKLLLPILLVLMFTIIGIYFLAVCYTTYLWNIERGGNLDLFMLYEPQNTPQMVLISNNTILPYSTIYYPQPKVYASLSGKYDKLINCLIKYESGGDELAVGDDGRAFSVLQFHKPTFNHFSKKYQVELDYYNANDQIILAGLMLEDNINNVRHWSVWRKCY